MRTIKLLFVTLILLNCKLLAQTPSGGIYSSNFGDFTIGVKDGVLTGKYLYLDHWDKELHTYMEQLYFDIYGKSKDGINYDVFAYDLGFDDELPVPGKVVFLQNGSKMKVTFKNVPGTGARFDVTGGDGNNIFERKNKVTIQQVGSIRSSKATLYNYDGQSFSPRKGYLIKGNDIAVINTIGNYSKVAYRNIESGKITEYYLKTTDLDLIPQKGLKFGMQFN